MLIKVVVCTRVLKKDGNREYCCDCMVNITAKAKSTSVKKCAPERKLFSIMLAGMCLEKSQNYARFVSLWQTRLLH